MALKGDRYENWLYTEFFMNETGEAGSVVVFDTTLTGLGSALDDSRSRVKLPDVAAGSGEVPAGILMCDVVNKDLLHTHLNEQKREVQVGGKVAFARNGDTVVTNRIGSGVTPKAGSPAYFTVEGVLTMTSTNSTRIGTFLSGVNADGYAKLIVNVA